MNCVVTGAAGFIGANLCEYLINQGHRVIGIDNLSNGNRNNIKSFSRNLNFKFFEIDIRDKKAMDTAFSEFKQINVVFHQAALGSVPRSFKIPMDVFNNNVVGFDVVLNTCHKHNVQKLIFASSSSVYGSNPKVIKTEGTEGDIKSPYALTKAINEKQAEYFNQIYGLEYYGLRYFNVFGPRQVNKGDYAPVIAKWIELAKNNKDIFINGNGETSRDFTYIDNVINANMICALNINMHAMNTCYNVGYGESISLNRLLLDISMLLRSKSKVYKIDERKGDVKHTKANLKKIKTLLGYYPTVSYSDGLKKLVTQNCLNPGI